MLRHTAVTPQTWLTFTHKQRKIEAQQQQCSRDEGRSKGERAEGNDRLSEVETEREKNQYLKRQQLQKSVEKGSMNTIKLSSGARPNQQTSSSCLDLKSVKRKRNGLTVLRINIMGNLHVLNLGLNLFFSF